MTTYNHIIGTFLGYPKCCIEAFGDVAIKFADRPNIVKQATVNGFVHCESCAKKLLAKEVSYEELINKNRYCFVPFKVEHTPEEEAQVNKEIGEIMGD